MRLSKKAEYALRAMVSLARKPHGPPLLIEEISSSERIPVKFLEQILLSLKRADLLRSKRGVGGGYQLNRSASNINLGEIIRVIDGPFEPMGCTTADPDKFGRGVCACGAPGGCGLGRVFTDLQRQVNDFLEDTTVADVLLKEARSSDLAFEI